VTDEHPKTQEERVLLIVDGDNIERRLLEESGIGLNHRALLNLIHAGCDRFQVCPPDLRVHTPVAPVAEAHYFKSVCTDPPLSWQGADQMTDEERAVYARTVIANREQYLRNCGYIPHVYGCRRNESGYPDSDAITTLHERMPFNTTAIVATGDRDFWPDVAALRQDGYRMFLAATADRIRPRRFQRGLPCPAVDLTTMGMFYTQIFTALPWRLPQRLSPLAATA
jgi:hypothetical protein